MITDEKNVCLKKLYLKLEEGTLATYFVWYASFQVGISSVKQPGACLL